MSNERPKDDHYRSPPECGRALFSVESLQGGVHEPCAGDGILAASAADIIGENAVMASTLHKTAKQYFTVIDGVDFLQTNSLLRPNIMTNFPYGYLNGTRKGKGRAATAFIMHALKLLEAAGPNAGKLCSLMDFRYRFSEERNKPGGLFRTHPPARIHAFMDRVTMYPANYQDDGKERNNGTQPYAWFIWEYPFFRPDYNTPVYVDMNSREFRHPGDMERFDLVPIGKKRKVAA